MSSLILVSRRSSASFRSLAKSPSKSFSFHSFSHSALRDVLNAGLIVVDNIGEKRVEKTLVRSQVYDENNTSKRFLSCKKTCERCQMMISREPMGSRPSQGSVHLNAFPRFCSVYFLLELLDSLSRSLCQWRYKVTNSNATKIAILQHTCWWGQRRRRMPQGRQQTKQTSSSLYST